MISILPSSAPLTVIAVNSNILCGNANIGLFLHVTSYPAAITSLKITECDVPSDVLSASTLAYYSPKNDIYNVFAGTDHETSNTAIKISPFAGYNYGGVCNSGDYTPAPVMPGFNTPSPIMGGGYTPQCADGSAEGMCISVYNCRDAFINNPLLSESGRGWIQFLDIPMSCAVEQNPLYLTGITVYLLNENAPAAGGFTITLEMAVYAMDKTDGLTVALLEANIASQTQRNELWVERIEIDDLKMSQNWNYADDFYELWFGLDVDSTFPLYGQECNQATDCMYYWELKVISNDRSDGVGPTLIGCYYQSDAMTFEVVTTNNVDTVTDAEGYDPSASGNGAQFDVAYRMDASCGEMGFFTATNCTGDWRYYIDASISVTGGSTTNAQWKNNQGLIKDNIAFALFDTLQEYTQWKNNYCYNPNPIMDGHGGGGPAAGYTGDCDCFAVDTFEVNFVNALTQFDMRFRINSDLFDAVTDAAPNGIPDDTLIQTNFLAKVYDHMSNQGTHNSWYDSTTGYALEAFELVEETASPTSAPTETAEACVGESTYHVIVSITVSTSEVSEEKWSADEDSVRNEFGMALYDALQEVATHNNYCYNPDSDSDCGCFGVDAFTMVFMDNDDTRFGVTYSINSDLYALMDESELDETDENIEPVLETNLYDRLSWFDDAEISITVTQFHLASGVACESTTGTTITVTFKISTAMDLTTWQLNDDDLNSVCIQSFIDAVYAVQGTLIEAECLSIPDIDLDADRRRRRLQDDSEDDDDDDTITIQFEIIVKQDAYDAVFGDDGFEANEDAFGDEFVSAFQTEIESEFGDDWYTDRDAVVTYEAASNNDDGGKMESVAFIDFQEDPMQAGITGIVALALFIAVFGYFNSWCRGADNFMISSVFFFGLYTWDFFSDVFFAALLYDSRLKGKQIGEWFKGGPIWAILFIASLIFIVFPVVKNIVDLLKFQGKWMKHPLHADRYKAWINQYMNILFLLSVVSGSTFGAIALVNSNFLGFRLFAMGLSQKDMRQFNQQRLWNVIIGENMPQLLIQIVFTGISDQFELIAFLAICSSSLSIAAAVFSFASNKKFLNDEMVHESMFSVKVTCGQTQFIRHPGHYKNKTYVLATEIARMFALDRNTVEILPSEKFSDKMHDGLVLYFFVSTSKRQPMEIYGELDESTKCQSGDKVSHLGKQIARAWGLRYGDDCTEDREQVKTYGLRWMDQEISSDVTNVTNVPHSGSQVELQTPNQQTSDATTTDIVDKKDWETIDRDRDANQKEVNDVTGASATANIEEEEECDEL